MGDFIISCCSTADVTEEFLKEKNIEQVLGIYPVNNANKAQFGGFYYENDALTLTKFTLKFPVAIRYEWGWVFDSELTWKVDTTHGNN